jgi:hypothetical protein
MERQPPLEIMRTGNVQSPERAQTQFVSIVGRISRPRKALRVMKAKIER